MVDADIKLQKEATPTAVGASGTHGLPPDLLAAAGGRLRSLCLVFAGVFLLAGPLSAVVAFLVSGSWDPRALLVAAIGIVAIALSLTVAALTRVSSLSAARILDIGLIYEVLFCFCISVAEYWGEQFTVETTELIGLSWVSVCVVFFAVVVPCTPWKALLAAIFSGSTVLITLALSMKFGGTVIDPELGAGTVFLMGGLSYLIVAVMAYIGARVVYKLGTDVGRARELGSYRLTEPLGQGGMGEVWRAQHRYLARPAAIKLIRPEVLGARNPGGGSAALERFKREAQATASLHSPHTIELFDFGLTSAGSFYYVMELLEGLDLDSLVRGYGPQDSSRVVQIMRQVCHSLEDAHQSGLTHRDIKPANIFLCKMGQEYDFVKVLDFGLVQFSSSRAPGDMVLTQEDSAPGTPAFIAPEMAQGDVEIDGRVDLYALGCVGYWLLTGKLVFEADNALQMVLQHVQGVVVPPSQRTELEILPELEAVILRCLEKDREKRPSSPAELSRLLAKCRIEPEPSWNQVRAQAWWKLHRPETQARKTPPVESTIVPV